MFTRIVCIVNVLHVPIGVQDRKRHVRGHFQEKTIAATELCSSIMNFFSMVMVNSTCCLIPPIFVCVALLENLTDDAIAQLHFTKFVTFSLYLSKLYVTQSFAKCSVLSHLHTTKIRQNFSNSVPLTCSVFASTDGTYISSGLLHVCREMINLYFRLVARKCRVKIDLSCVAAGIAGRQDPNAGSRYKSYNK